MKRDIFLTPWDVLNYCLLGVAGIIIAIDFLLFLASVLMVATHAGILK